MSDNDAPQEINKTYDDSVVEINNKYFSLLEELIEKFKYHDELIGPLQSDLNLAKEKIEINSNQIIDTITDHLLFCLEQLCDHNSDYFIYQKDKIVKKNKVQKKKMPKIGNKTTLKKILKECDNTYTTSLFTKIVSMFDELITKNENNEYIFKNEYVNYIKTDQNDNKNYSKMLMIIDNLNNIYNSKIEETEELIEEDEEVDEKPTRSKKNKNKKSKKKGNFENDFMKNLENTKIAELAKDISKKINIDDFPELTDPSKLINSLGGNSEEGGGIQNLLKMVVGEVEDAFKNKNLNEKDLMGEAQNIMGQFKNMSGIDPLSILTGNKDNIDLNQFSDIFSNMQK